MTDVFKVEDFIYENHYGDAVRMVASKSAQVANTKVAPLVAENAKLKLHLEIWKRRVGIEQKLTEEFRAERDEAEAEIAALKAKLEVAPVVYGWKYKGSVHEGIDEEWMWTPEKDSKDTHQALLVDVKELAK